MVEGQRAGAQVRDRHPGRSGRVGAGVGHGQVGGEGEVGDADHPHPRVAGGGAVAAQLLDVHGRGRQPCLLGELAERGGLEVLAGLHEPSGQGAAAEEGLLAALDGEHAERVVADGQDDEVDGDGHRGIGVGLVGHAREPTALSSS